ncbi:MAG TPA: glycosyltransferase [Pirellulales bacterium]
MPRQLVILNNGLRDHCGHYFETSISVAEAARRAGWRPVLATHVECRPELLPDGLDAYPLFRTDHWMDQPPAELGAANTAVREAGVSFAERKTTMSAERKETLQAVRTAAAGGIYRPERHLAQSLCQAWRLGRRCCWAGQRAAFYLLPPALDEAARWFAKGCIPRILRRQYRAPLRARLVQWVEALRRSDRNDAVRLAGMPHLAQALRDPARSGLVAAMLAALAPDQAREIEYGLVFLDDLERLLSLTGAAAGDHVLLGTAHAREVLAVCLVAQRWGARSPTFHLEFRHSLFRCEPTQAEFEHAPLVRMYRAFLSLAERDGCREHVRFYTDTEELSGDYQLLAGRPVGVLPIPFRGEHIRPVVRRPGEPLRLAYLGEARDEKGFPYLPGLVDRLYKNYFRNGRARLLVQANVSAPQFNPLSAASLDRLKRFPIESVELLGLDAPLTPEDYYALVSRADVVLLPYERNRYRACSSGTLAEALAGGRPVVAPARSWMSAQLPPGAGEVFYDEASFCDAVERLIEHYDEYRARAEAHAAAWRAKHSPDALVAALVGAAQSEPASLAA